MREREDHIYPLPRQPQEGCPQTDRLQQGTERQRGHDDEVRQRCRRQIGGQPIHGRAVEMLHGERPGRRPRDQAGQDAVQSIEALIAELDRKLSEQLNLILHHPEFQRLEGAWRGLQHLVSHTETDEGLKIRVLDVSKAELGRTLRKFKGTSWDQSPLFKKVYEEEYGQLGGEPFGCLIGDYYFDHSPPDTELLGEMARIAAAAHAPFIAGAAPAVLQMDSWQELANPRDLGKIFSTPEYAAWRALRASDDARYLGLALPRFLARLPYGARTHPLEAFDFEEDTGAADHSKYTWANAAYAEMARKTGSSDGLIRLFSRYSSGVRLFRDS